MKPFPFFLLVVIVLCDISISAANDLSLKKTDGGYQVNIDGQLFAEYLIDFHGTPILWPIIGPSGTAMTRAFPMNKENPDENQDHPHHRSLWFNHDGVNGNSFWTSATIAHQEFLKAESDGQTVVLVAKNLWLDEKMKQPVCSDIRTITFGTTENARYLDFDVTVTAEQEKVTFPDTKEGTFGIRVPSSMDVDAKKRNQEHGGTIINADGRKNGDSWGKRSNWVDYSGPVDGKVVGITVMNHPKSFRYPTYWHVRTYGLLAANPFGVSDFENDRNQSEELVLKKGESFQLRYRVIFHDGDATAINIPELFEKYTEKP